MFRARVACCAAVLPFRPTSVVVPIAGTGGPGDAQLSVPVMVKLFESGRPLITGSCPATVNAAGMGGIATFATSYWIIRVALFGEVAFGATASVVSMYTG